HVPGAVASRGLVEDCAVSGPLVLALVIGALVALQLWFPWRRARRRAHLRSLPLSDAQRREIAAAVPLVAQMPNGYRAVFEGLVQQFLAEKRFVGCNGLRVTDHMRLVIAAQGCLLLIGRAGGCFDDLRTVLVYPDAFFVEHDAYDADGVVHAGRDLRAGESWSNGQIVVSWADVELGAADPDDAYNVVIHEFAHQLDGESGAVNGAPSLVQAEAAAHWPGRMRREYDALVRAVDRGAHTFIDPYAATDPAEFFAVLSEVFFEMPDALRQRHRVLYDCLDAVYGIDPARW
ncbi:MAG: M90 family metallopeptidase, partial [Pseudomonadota bacterium]